MTPLPEAFAELDSEANPNYRTRVHELAGQLGNMESRGLERAPTRKAARELVERRLARLPLDGEHTPFGVAGYGIAYAVAGVLREGAVNIRALARLPAEMQLEFARRKAEAATSEARAALRAEEMNELARVQLQMLDDLAGVIVGHIVAASERAVVRHQELQAEAAAKPGRIRKAGANLLEQPEALKPALSAWREEAGGWSSGPASELGRNLEVLERTVRRSVVL